MITTTLLLLPLHKKTTQDSVVCDLCAKRIIKPSFAIKWFHLASSIACRQINPQVKIIHLMHARETLTTISIYYYIIIAVSFIGPK